MLCCEGTDHPGADGQHIGPLVETQRLLNMHLCPRTPAETAGNTPAVPPLLSPCRFVSGVNSLISDRPSRSADLTDNQLLTYLETHFPQALPWRMCTPSHKLASGIASALRRKTSARDCLLDEPPPPMATGPSGPISVQGWTLTPYSSLIKTLSPSSTPSLGTTELETSRPTALAYDPEQLRMPYGRLDRRSRCWGPSNQG